MKGKGGDGEETGGEGQGGRGRRGEVDSDAQLEQGRRLAKAGPVRITQESLIYTAFRKVTLCLISLLSKYTSLDENLEQ